MTGKVTEHEMREAHPVEYDRLKDSPYRVPPEGSASAGGGDQRHDGQGGA